MNSITINGLECSANESEKVVISSITLTKEENIMFITCGSVFNNGIYDLINSKLEKSHSTNGIDYMACTLSLIDFIESLPLTNWHKSYLSDEEIQLFSQLRKEAEIWKSKKCNFVHISGWIT